MPHLCIPSIFFWSIAPSFQVHTHGQIKPSSLLSSHTEACLKKHACSTWLLTVSLRLSSTLCCQNTLTHLHCTRCRPSTAVSPFLPHRPSLDTALHRSILRCASPSTNCLPLLPSPQNCRLPLHLSFPPGRTALTFAAPLPLRSLSLYSTAIPPHLSLAASLLSLRTDSRLYVNSRYITAASWASRSEALAERTYKIIGGVIICAMADAWLSPLSAMELPVSKQENLSNINLISKKPSHHISRHKNAGLPIAPIRGAAPRASASWHLGNFCDSAIHVNAAGVPCRSALTMWLPALATTRTTLQLASGLAKIDQ
jgi:hypothetical protein